MKPLDLLRPRALSNFRPLLRTYGFYISQLSSIELGPGANKKADLVSVGTKAKMLHGLAGILGSTQEKSVRSSWRPKSELIQSQCLTPSFLNPGSSSGGKAKRSHGHLGHRQKAVVISNRPDDDHSLALVRLGDVRNDTRNRDGRAIDSRHKEPTQNDLVEVGIRAACGMSLISLVYAKVIEQADLKIEGQSIRARKR